LEYIGASATFFIYFVIMIISIVFIYYYIPETKGMTLEEIENFFNDKADEDNNNIDKLEFLYDDLDENEVFKTSTLIKT
jgi:major inositol transporter-like SP family MFS transporter